MITYERRADCELVGLELWNLRSQGTEELKVCYMTNSRLGWSSSPLNQWGGVVDNGRPINLVELGYVQWLVRRFFAGGLDRLNCAARSGVTTGSLSPRSTGGYVARRYYSKSSFSFVIGIRCASVRDQSSVINRQSSVVSRQSSVGPISVDPVNG
jgi:hypothetical protein